jgi:hypothetical protein
MSRKLVELEYEAPVANLDSLEFGPVNASVSETPKISIQIRANPKDLFQYPYNMPKSERDAVTAQDQ